MTLLSFDDAVDVWLPVSDYRARWSISGLDAGRAQDVASDEEPAPDRYELAFWPAALGEDSIVRVTGSEARYAHEERSGR